MASALVATALTAAIAPHAVVAHIQERQDLDRRIAELKRLRERLDAQERDVRHGISAADARRDALTTELEELQAVVDEVQARVNDAAFLLARIQARVDARTAELRRLEHELAQTLNGLHARAIQVYKQGPGSIFDMLLTSSGVGELLRRFGYVLQIVHEDNQQLRSIRRTKTAILRERDAITKLRDKAAQQMAVVVRERNHAASIANTVAGERQAVLGDLSSRYAKLGSIQNQRAQYQREQAELEAESAATAAFLKGQGGGTATVSKRGMIWPVGGRVTSGYGWRTHPVFGDRRFHSGIDIGASSGTPVAAAATGKVIFAGRKNGYGNTLIIDHRGGIATLYAHLSAFTKGVGTVVARGSQVARVGCTGYCTGPHLHFEVRVNGDTDDPMKWLP